jgi:hypothetical protein
VFYFEVITPAQRTGHNTLCPCLFLKQDPDGGHGILKSGFQTTLTSG